MEFAMNRVVPGKEFPPRNALISATEIGDETARFPHQQHTRRHVPRLEITFPETFIAACRHMGQIKRSRAEAANASHLTSNCTKYPGPLRPTAMSEKRNRKDVGEGKGVLVRVKLGG